MNLFDVIPEDEKYLIDTYINRYAEINTTKRASLDHILRVWATHKERLYALLGNQLQVKKKIEYTAPREVLVENMMKLFRDDNKFRSISYKFRNWIQSEDIPDDIKENAQFLREIFSYITFADNSINMYFMDYVVKISTPSGKTISIQHGSKPIKIISKIAKEFGVLTEEEVEYIRIKQSQVLNQKKIKGTLVLSIHPLDYMTMSDNASGWSSCMSWQEYGCYRRGTVEMMNSETVVVAYLESEQPMKMYTPEGDKEWNNKKWRQLFVVNDDIIASVKSYPYFNEELTTTALDWLAELLEINGGIKFNKHAITFYSNETYDFVFSDNYCFEFYTDDMYNDFYTTTHYARISNPEVKYYEINYSGPRECMSCGGTDCYFDDDEAPLLCCEDCYDLKRCDDCGCCCEETYELDGCYFCEECYDDHAQKEFLTNEVHYDGNLYNYIMLPKTLRGSSSEEIANWITNNDVIDELYMLQETASNPKYFVGPTECFNVMDRTNRGEFCFTKIWQCFFEDSLREEYRDRVDTYEPYDY